MLRALFVHLGRSGFILRPRHSPQENSPGEIPLAMLYEQQKPPAEAEAPTGGRLVLFVGVVMPHVRPELVDFAVSTVGNFSQQK